MTELFCKNCGGILNPIDDGHCKCENCGSVFAEDSAKRQKQLLDSFLGAQKQEQLNSLRRHLWQEANAELVNSEKILSICLSIKNLYPEDFLANFYDAVCSGNGATAVAFIDSIDVDEQFDSIEVVIDFLIKSLKAEYLLSVNNLIERAFKGKNCQKYNHFTARFEKMAEEVQNGVYELSISRDVFVSYASEDIDRVHELVDYLEDQGISCFVEMRNIQHGAGAANNYHKSIETAIDNSKVFLFVSSKNSRNLKCEALTHQLPYFKNSDSAKLSAKFPNVPYERIDLSHKKARIQWRLDDEKSGIADRTVAEVFAGLDYCYSLESILSRVNKYLLGGAMAFEVGMKDLISRGESEKSIEPIEFFDVYFDSYTRDSYGPSQIISAISSLSFDEARAVVLNKGIIKSGVSREESNSISSKLKAFGATVKVVSQTARLKNKQEISKDFKIENGVLLQYLGDKKEVTVPSGVTEIGANAFAFSKAGNKITSVCIQDGVTKIAAGAFLNCYELQNVEIPSSVEVIEENAFINCNSLKNVSLYGVKTIGEYAFSSCENLMSVILGESVNKIGKYAFSGCSSISAINIPESVKEIGERAFANCSTLEQITFNEGILSIGSYAFSGCKRLTEVLLPESITALGSNVFGGCIRLTVTLTNGKNSKNWRLDWSATVMKVCDKKGKKEGSGFLGLFKKKNNYI